VADIRMPRFLLALSGACVLHVGVAFNPASMYGGIKRARSEALNANTFYEKSVLGTAAAAAAAVSQVAEGCAFHTKPREQ
jgi:hypothetical protein